MISPTKPILARGVAHFNAKRYAQAAASFSEVLRLEPGNSSARYFLTHALSCARPGREVRDSSIMASLSRIRLDLKSGRLDEAFRRCEELLSAGRSPEIIEGLLSFPESPAEPLSEKYSLELLRRIGAHARPRPAAPWPRLALAYLHYRHSHAAEALAAARAMPLLSARYGWMRFLRGKIQLHFFCAYGKAREDFSAALRSEPTFWPAKAYLAEALLCGGSRGALGLFDELLRELRGPHRANAQAWRGELRLWRGDYSGALRDLSAAARQGAPFAKCWKGAARLLLGKTAQALRDLSEALRLDGNDAEALIWRAESHRRSGRQEAAINDADAALRLHPENFWARLNRASARARLGDRAGMKADVAQIPPRVLRFFERELGVKTATARPGEMSALLEGALRLGRGVRTPQPYVFPVWMRKLL